MKRRDFVGKSGCGLLSVALAYFGLSSCKKKEEAPAMKAPAETPAQEASAAPTQREMIQKLLVEKMGKTEDEAAAMIAEFEQKLPDVRTMCICETCPSYVPEETEEAFCHPLVGKSKIITEEKGCDCPKCPVYKNMGMKNGYYCTRKSELEQEAAKMV